ncbi:Hypothetical protein D9617_5g069280 [Elsinoe fawcettii]|nr:Hypothetical protein D9617_5g069280 [Elsinoe fawcettii]
MDLDEGSWATLGRHAAVNSSQVPNTERNDRPQQDAGVESKEEPLPSHLVKVLNDQDKEDIVPVASFFGGTWDEIIRQSHQGKARDLSSLRLAITLRPDQEDGIRRLINRLNSPFKGAILGQPVRHGRMTQAIIATRINADRHGCFTLVVTHAYHLQQCKKDVEETFRSDSRPNVRVQESPDHIRAKDLIFGGDDVVITSFSALRKDYQEHHRLTDKLEGAMEAGSESLRVRTQGQLDDLAFFSPLYKRRNKPFKHVVIDQAHCREAQGTMHQAFRTLERSTTILLTSALIKNRWYNVGPLITLLEGHPFTSLEEFQRVFGKAAATQSEQERCYLTKLLMPAAIASSPSRPPIPTLSVHSVAFAMSYEQAVQTIFIIIRYYRSVRVRLQQQGSSNQDRRKITDDDLLKTIEEEHDTPGDVKLIAMAQSLAGHLVQVDQSPTTLDEMITSIKDFREAFGLSVPVNLDLGADIENFKDLIATKVRSSNQYDHLLPDSARDTSKDYDRKTSKSQKKKTSDERWQERFDMTEPSTLDEGRIGKIIELLQDLEQHCSGALVDFRKYGITATILTHHNKILLCGQHDRFMSLLERAIRHFLPQTVTVRYPDKEGNRPQIRRTFEASQSAQTVMLITGSTHGANLKLLEATAIIQTEPWLVHDDEVEAWSRCHRIGQTKDVTVFQMVGQNSMVDLFVTDLRDSKNKDIQKYMRYLRPEVSSLDSLLEELNIASTAHHTADDMETHDAQDFGPDLTVIGPLLELERLVTGSEGYSSNTARGQTETPGPEGERPHKRPRIEAADCSNGDNQEEDSVGGAADHIAATDRVQPHIISNVDSDTISISSTEEEEVMFVSSNIIPKQELPPTISITSTARLPTGDIDQEALDKDFRYSEGIAAVYLYLFQKKRYLPAILLRNISRSKSQAYEVGDLETFNSRDFEERRLLAHL